MNDEEQIREDLIAFLRTIARLGQQIEAGNDDVNLFDSGLLDSLAVIQIILYLEQNYGVNIVAHGIDPTDLGTIGGILSAIRRGFG